MKTRRLVPWKNNKIDPIELLESYLYIPRDTVIPTQKFQVRWGVWYLFNTFLLDSTCADCLILSQISVISLSAVSAPSEKSVPGTLFKMVEVKPVLKTSIDKEYNLSSINNQ